MPNASRSERVINVADIDPRYRHAILFRLFEHLPLDDSLQIIVDHDPRRLRRELEARHGSRCVWSYLEEGRMSGAFVCASFKLGVETMIERRVSASDPRSGDLGNPVDASGMRVYHVRSGWK